MLYADLAAIVHLVKKTWLGSGSGGGVNVDSPPLREYMVHFC